MKKLILGAFVFILITDISYGQDSRFLYGGSSEKQIRERILEAKHCEVKGDCVMANLGCPYECNIFIHKDKVAQLEKDALESKRLSGTQCDYMCVNPIDHDCVDHQCIAITESPNNLDGYQKLPSKSPSLGKRSEVPIQTVQPKSPDQVVQDPDPNHRF